MFNDYYWKSYLSGAGAQTVAFFKSNRDSNLSDDYANTICQFHQAYCPSESDRESLKEELSDLYETAKSWDKNQSGSDETAHSIDDIMAWLYHDFFGDSQSQEPATAQQKFGAFSNYIGYYTTMLWLLFPQRCIPYYFYLNYNILEKIAEEFEIDLPPIPLKKEYQKRFFHYGEICKSLHNFRIKHVMTVDELCAFLYDFAPKAVGGITSYIIKDLPTPKSAYFIGSSEKDLFLSYEKDYITPWQCNPETKAGDMIVMYLTTPVSAVDSIWRSVSIGFNDPFFYYYRCTYIARPSKINRIPLKILKSDPVFSQLSIVRKNMQGVNGVEILPSVYNYLLDTAHSDLERLEFVISDENIPISNEKDVEEKRVKPFLKELGYDKSEYQQQLYIEIGNHNHALIPDFVILPTVSKGHQSAYFLVEAKRSIPSQKLLHDAKTQARGYAKLLNAQYTVIASQEGIWITGREDDYTSDIVSFSWSELQNEDNFYAVFKILGKEKSNQRKSGFRSKRRS